MTALTFRLAVLAAAFMVLGSAVALAVDTEETPATTAVTNFDAVRALVDDKKFDDALPKLRQLDQESPNNPDILNLIGFSLRKTGKMDEALGYYTRALALNPTHLGANEYLGELYLQTRQPDKAKERLAVLRQACGDCEEFEDLSAQIDRYAAQ
ncbi:MAG TPA: tetratricopeptide repeat protein [Dongiaceae bacterium]|nr:tetratricopeptide repeat protein [Dongiaceae bacterium]